MLYTVIALGAMLAASLGFIGYIIVRHRKELAHFRDISDLEAYAKDCQQSAQTSLAQRDSAVEEHRKQIETIKGLKSQIAQYQQVVRDFKSASELQQYVKQMSAFAKGLHSLSELQAKIDYHVQLADQYKSEAQKLGYAVDDAKGAGSIAEQIQLKRDELALIQKDIQSVEEVKDLQECGFYHRKYEFDSSEQYKKRQDSVRDQQKQMIKQKTAATCGTEWVVEGSKAKGKKMISDKIKLLLRAFNGETDAAIAKVNYSNATTMEGRINKSFEQITKMGEVNQVSISAHYLELKLQELYLQHEYQLQKFEEKEEQRRIKQMMIEEAKVEKEIEKAQEDAEREESMKRQALERARAELREKEGAQTEKLAFLVQKLETELQEAIDRKVKAIARAQLTKSGHVYVLSNLGSFGENVYKIGMTRRLEPLERVKELGSASVPFLFDVHAMIYSENAPELEYKLHRYFEHRRVNVVNMRKEFFNVSMAEIREAVQKNFGVVTFMVEPEAAEYRQTQAFLKEKSELPVPVEVPAREVELAVSM